jgi:hypothetical protein
MNARPLLVLAKPPADDDIASCGRFKATAMQQQLRIGCKLVSA